MTPTDPREHQSRRTFSTPKPIQGRRGQGRRGQGRRGQGPRDANSADRAVRMFSIVGGGAGFVLGIALGVFLARTGKAPGWVALLCPFIMAAAVSGLTLWITNASGAAGSKVYAPSGKTTPPKKEYSQAEAMVVQGRYEDGITAFELAISEGETDPTPYLRIARVYRDNLARHEDAARWFRRALRESDIRAGVAVLARKELVELYTHRLGQPERALPELARLAEEFEGTADGAWAAGHYAEIRAEIRARLSSPQPGEGEDPPTTP